MKTITLSYKLSKDVTALEKDRIKLTLKDAGLRSKYIKTSLDIMLIVNIPVLPGLNIDEADDAIRDIINSNYDNYTSDSIEDFEEDIDDDKIRYNDNYMNMNILFKI